MQIWNGLFSVPPRTARFFPLFFAAGVFKKTDCYAILMKENNAQVREKPRKRRSAV